MQLKTADRLAESRKALLFGFNLKEPSKKEVSCWTKDQILEIIDNRLYSELPDPKYSLVFIDYIGPKTYDLQAKSHLDESIPTMTSLNQRSGLTSPLVIKEGYGPSVPITKFTFNLEDSKDSVRSPDFTPVSETRNAKIKPPYKRVIAATPGDVQSRFRVVSYSASPKISSRRVEIAKQSGSRPQSSKVIVHRRPAGEKSTDTSINKTSKNPKRIGTKGPLNIPQPPTTSKTQQSGPPGLFLRGKRPITGTCHNNFSKPKPHPSRL